MLVRRYLLPMPIRNILLGIDFLSYVRMALKSIREERSLTVEVLDASAIGLSIYMNDLDSARSIIFLLDLGEKLEEWTMDTSESDFRKSLSIKVDNVWLVQGDKKILSPISDIEIGDKIEVATGNMIPVDGIVRSGSALVNESSMTGEAIPVEKFEGNAVYAGTSIDNGRLIIEVRKKPDGSRINQIVDMIIESENLKTDAELRAKYVAEKLVKFSFAGFGLTLLITRNLQRASAFMMVDYSCALKLVTPIATMRAMTESLNRDILVKGGKYLETLAQIDTIVFDKTGTLTNALPSVEKLVSFSDRKEENILKDAACIEEHFPHSIANAIVNYAIDKGVHHKGENHTNPEYVVAHGIVSSIEGDRVCIGSEHFILEDENVSISNKTRAKIDELKEDYSILYFARAGELEAVFCIDDPLREDAIETVKGLRDLGIEKMVMLTGDSENSARFAFDKLDLDDYRSQVLPEDKADYIENDQSQGRAVLMIGDGINDSVALSKADVSMSMSSGADLARQVANISINNESLYSIVEIIKIARELESRIEASNRSIIAINSGQIVLGVLQIISNTSSSLVHNLATVSIALANMQDY